VPFYAFPSDVRRILYTTNANEALNSKLRRAVRARGHFPNDKAATKLLFLVLNRSDKEWIVPPCEWSMAKAQFAVLFGERFTYASGDPLPSGSPARQEGATMLLFAPRDFALAQWRPLPASSLRQPLWQQTPPRHRPWPSTSLRSARRRSARPPPQEAPFLSENVGAMTRRMIGMEIKPSGDVDTDFAAMMIPHHQGAIEMAQAELRHGHNEQLRRIAQEIIVTQQQEIAAMRLALGQPLPPSVAAPDQPSDLSAGAPQPTSTSTVNTRCALLSGTVLVSAASGWAGQAPAAASAPDIPISHHDRFYTADQFSNTVSVIDPADNKLLGVIRLGELVPANFSPLYKGQLLVHGMGYSPDHRTLDVVSIGSNSVTFIDTATNAVKHVTYVGRSPHEAFFTLDGKEVWVTVRGENYVSVLDGTTYEEKTRITTNNGPGMTIFSPDGKYGYVCSSFTPETVVIAVADHTIVGRVPQASPFCPDIAATPDGAQV
jgi:YVTN family beta-propeller protein